MNPKPNDEQLATKWACDERTIRRWRRDKAPLHDPKRMVAWLSGRKNLPPGTRALLEKLRTERSASTGQEHKTQAEGAAGALKRLESAELRAWADHKKATASGDMLAIKTSRQNWLEISESLRRYDLAIEQARRDSGDLVPRAEAERVIAGFACVFLGRVRQDFEMRAPALAGLVTAETIWPELRRVLTGGIIAACGALRTWPYGGSSIPGWAVQAAEDAIKGHEAIMNISELAAQMAENMRKHMTPPGK